MKKLLFVLILLAMSVPAGATVYVYNIKAVDTGMSTNDDGSTWDSYKKPFGGYFIFGPGSSDSKVDIWAIWTWKESGGKYAFAENWGEANRVEAQIPVGTKTKWSWIVNYVDPNSRTMVMGEMKVKKVGLAKSSTCLSCHSSQELAGLGDIAPNIPAKLVGSSVVDDNEGPTWWDMWTETLTLTFNTKATLKGHTDNHFTSVAVKDAILDDLHNAGYNTSTE
jgi:hypothetical protein